MKQEAILMVEDDANDVFFARRAVNTLGIDLMLQVAMNGLEAVKYLEGSGQFHDREKYPLPFILFLDLKLPLKTGLEVLEWIRSRAAFDIMPVIIFTSSKEESDIRKAYQLRANSYLVKPHTLERFQEKLHNAIKYWKSVNVLP
jgi:CheY-like chemotaxis protein